MDNTLKQKTISFRDTNGEMRYNKTITLTKNGKSKTYFKVIPGVDDYTIKDLTNFIKYKGEYYA